MKKLMAAVLGLALVAGSSSAFAQADPQDLGVFFDAAGTVSTTTAADFATFNIYLITFDIGDISAWEAGVTLPTAWTVLSTTFSTPGALNIGQTGNYIVGLGTCVNASGAYPVLTLNGGFFVGGASAGEHLVCITPSSPSSVADAGAAFVDCSDGLFVFGVAQNGSPDYPNGCGVINASSEPPVATESSSMGALKASF